ncbi:hypothetical protein [Candidatus Lokiarchaeum ossiferum]|uniref:hypothetical protein n=1 Tax=Candidatus Lokiarchaeum ossiferum TaxID=2951803 RepID=UPI00352BF4B7
MIPSTWRGTTRNFATRGEIIFQHVNVYLVKLMTNIYFSNFPLRQNQLFALILILGTGTFFLNANAETGNTNELWVKFYSDLFFEDLSTQFTMDDFIGIEAFLPAYNTTDADEISFWASTIAHPEMIHGILNETTNMSSIYQGLLRLSFDHSNDANSVNGARIECDRLGDNVTIWLDVGNNGTKEIVGILPINLVVEKNMMYDVARVTWATMLLPITLGILFSFVPNEKILLFLKKRTEKRKIKPIKWIFSKIEKYFQNYADNRKAIEKMGDNASNGDLGSNMIYFIKAMWLGIPMACILWVMSIIGIWVRPFEILFGAIPLEYRTPFWTMGQFLLYKIVFGSLVSTILIMVGMIFPEMYKMLMNPEKALENPPVNPQEQK